MRLQSFVSAIWVDLFLDLNLSCLRCKNRNFRSVSDEAGANHNFFRKICATRRVSEATGSQKDALGLDFMGTRGLKAILALT